MKRRRAWAALLLTLLAVLPVWSQFPWGLTLTSWEGLTIQLSEVTGAAAPAAEPTAPAPPEAPSEPLSAAESQALFNRLPPLVFERADVKGFAIRPATQPPPRADVVEQVPFPPPPSVASTPPPCAAAGALEVTRHEPEGNVHVAPSLDVSFNQPMVPVTSLSQLAQPPVHFTPDLPGQWHWLDSQTASFVPKGNDGAERFPMSTEISVDIPAGSTSQLGGRLASPVRWSFKTPTVEAALRHPGMDDVDLHPLIWLEMNQNVDPRQVLEHVHMSVPLRLATDEEVRAGLGDRASGPSSRHQLLMVPTHALEPSTAYTLTLARGTPSAEGPLRTTTDQRFVLHTYGALKVVEVESDSLPTELSVKFTNVLDPASLTAERVTVEPELPDKAVRLVGQFLTLSGKFHPRATYRVTLPADLRDLHGQRLGHPEAVTCKVPPAKPFLKGPNGQIVVLDPAGPRLLRLRALNCRQLHVEAYRVSPSDWAAYCKLVWEWRRGTGRFRFCSRRQSPVSGR